jgi:hypothetical protein
MEYNVIGHKINGSYISLMDNSCKRVDGHIFRGFPNREDLYVEDLRNAEKDYVILVWEDYASLRGSNTTNLKDRML